MTIHARAREIAAEANLPPEGFLALVQAESNWNPNATSSAGAVGLTQLMLAAAVQTGVVEASEAVLEEYVERYQISPSSADEWLLSQAITDRRTDPEISLRGGADYLAWLAYDYVGPKLPVGEPLWPAVLASYNWGPTPTLAAIDARGRLDWADLPASTRDYLARVAPLWGQDVISGHRGPTVAAVGGGSLLLLALIWLVARSMSGRGGYA